MADAQFVQVGHDCRRIAESQLFWRKLKAICRHRMASAILHHPFDGIGYQLSPIGKIAHDTVVNSCRRIKHFVWEQLVQRLIFNAASSVTGVFGAKHYLFLGRFQGWKGGNFRRKIGHDKQSVARRRVPTSVLRSKLSLLSDVRGWQLGWHWYAAGRAGPATGAGQPKDLDKAAGVAHAMSLPAMPKRAWLPGKSRCFGDRGFPSAQSNRRAANSSRRPRRTASMSAGSLNEQKNGNGLCSPYSSPMNNKGTHGESNSNPHASRCAAGEMRVARRSPRARFPTWS